MTSANPLPQDAESELQAWIENPAVVALLRAKNWKDAFSSYNYLQIPARPPFAPMKKPLREATIAVITSGGLYVSGEQDAFNAADVYGDPSIRTFSIDTPPQRLKIAHDHYDHTVPEKDLRTIDPIANLKVLQAEGFIGGIHSPQISFSGYMPDWHRIFDRLIPAVLDELRGKPIDAALLVPV